MRALIIATGHRVQPSAVKPAPTSCRRRLDVAFVARAAGFDAADGGRVEHALANGAVEIINGVHFAAEDAGVHVSVELRCRGEDGGAHSR
ncbi:MAG: hypothetical protein IT523_01910 [Burkholderiales bacterium]|nr:hypothetical protein [Burkholderiales bacterium]